MYIGASGVTADNSSTGGVMVDVGQTVTVPTYGDSLGDTPALYAVTGGGTAYVSWLMVAP